MQGKIAHLNKTCASGKKRTEENSVTRENNDEATDYHGKVKIKKR